MKWVEFLICWRSNEHKSSLPSQDVLLDYDLAEETILSQRIFQKFESSFQKQKRLIETDGHISM